MSESESAIALLYREEGDRLWRAVFAFARDRDIASDAVAEAFAQCIRRGQAVRSPRDWVWKAAFRIAAGELQRRGLWNAGMRDPGPTPEPPETSERLVAALASLSAHQRAAFLLRHVGGYSASAIGGILGCSPSTARVHVFRAKRKLRAHLEETNESSE